MEATATARMREMAERVEITLDELLAFLDSPPGRRLRGILATGLIVSVPLLMRIPGLRKTVIGRLLELTGGAALVIKLAEAIRDWERHEPTRRRPRGQVVDVPRSA